MVDESIDGMAHLAIGQRFAKRRNFEEAEHSFRRAIALDPELPMAHNNLGWVRQLRGDPDHAIECYRRALALNDGLTLARVNLATLFGHLRRFAEALQQWDVLVDARGGDATLLNAAVEVAMLSGDLTRGARWAAARASLVRGVIRDGETRMLLPGPRTTQISVAKLRHDVEQLRYIRSQSSTDEKLDNVIARFEQALKLLAEREENEQIFPGNAEWQLIGDIYGRLFHVRPTPRIARCLSSRWDAASAEKAYRSHPLGLVVVDNFLCDEALHDVRRFCLESTVWSTSHFSHGRLGAFFREGFNCPLLVQIAEELQNCLPDVIGDKHPLLQLWGFKYSAEQPRTAAHADFAHVNVNFWITPDEANLNASTGGMVIYDVEAPKDWSFDSYNAQGNQIDSFLRQQGAAATPIPYRANRAVIFNSDLFHATMPLRFHNEYKHRRINITMLYGMREQ